jgi:uncharacterized protein (TIGR00369 family)
MKSKYPTPNSILNNQDMLDLVAHVFMEHIPFNQVIGMSLGVYTDTKVELSFSRRDELIGNKMRNILHGGVTSTALDTVGGLFAARSIYQELQECTLEEFQQRFSKIGTIDLRVDYLRPGRGERFIASASLLRSGNKVAVCRMELHNEKQELIAVGTGTYLVG